jgi:hypothetical protein
VTSQEFIELRKTMPWSEMALNVGRHTLIRVLDNTGAEVPLLTLVKFNIFISQQLAASKESA